LDVGLVLESVEYPTVGRWCSTWGRRFWWWVTSYWSNWTWTICHPVYACASPKQPTRASWGWPTCASAELPGWTPWMQRG